MSEILHLTRARLRRDAEMSAIAPLLLPDDDDARIAANHRLAWSLFAKGQEENRNFLWREEAPGRLIILSAAPPSADRRLFELETRPFATMPKSGERFAFALRANPTASIARNEIRPNGKRRSGERVDVVMRALRPTPGRRGPDGGMTAPLAPGEGRAFVRDGLLGWLDDSWTKAPVTPHRPALDWLALQGERKGFAIERDLTRIAAYRRVALPRRGEPRKPAVFGQVDYEGVLSVTDAGAFAIALREGIGRGRAFGCGLMLIARQPAAGTA